jgi:hypothetical protein
MRQMARRDEMIFRLLGLRLQFRTRVRNLQANDGMWVFTPNSYRGQSNRNRKPIEAALACSCQGVDFGSIPVPKPMFSPDTPISEFIPCPPTSRRR